MLLNDGGNMKRKIFGLFFIMFFSLYPYIPACRPITGMCRITGYKIRGNQVFESEMPIVKEIIEILNNSLGENVKIKIVGHTDNLESLQKMKLSRARALETYNLMKEYGLREDIEVEIIGVGSLEAIADNGSDIGRYLNRRVEILFDTKSLRKSLWKFNVGGL